MNDFDDLFNVNPKEEQAEEHDEKTDSEKEGKAFNKEDWVKQKKQERETTFALIEEAAVMAGKDGNKFREVLDVMAQFDRYSVGNALLVAVQKPDAMRLADSKTWKENNVYIKKGEVGIRILEPGNEYTKEDGTTGVTYNVKVVFDVSQTNAKEQEPSKVYVDERLMLKALLNNAPCSVSIHEEMRFPDNVSAVYVPEDSAIYVKKGMDGPEAFRNLSRELSLANLAKTGDYSRANHIFKALASTYILCKRNGISTEDFNFTELPKNITELDVNGMRNLFSEIRDTANTISQNMNQVLNKQREAKTRSGGAR